MKWIVGESHNQTVRLLAEHATRMELNISFLGDAGAELILELAGIAPVDLTVSSYMRVTRRSALERLLGELVGQSVRGARLRVRVATREIQGFHGKAYGFHYADRPSAWLVGSANLTDSGQSGLGDVSVMFAGSLPPFPWSASLEAHLRMTRWAERGCPTPLREFIKGYADNPYRGGPFEEDHTVVCFLAGVCEASPSDWTFVQNAVRGEADDQESPIGDADASNDCWQLIVNSTSDSAKFRVLNACRVGDVVVRGWKGQELIQAYPIRGLVRGSRDGKDVVVAFFDAEREVEIPRAECGSWVSRVMDRRKIPQTLVQATSFWSDFV